jgi:hypothetical protein
MLISCTHAARARAATTTPPARRVGSAPGSTTSWGRGATMAATCAGALLCAAWAPSAHAQRGPEPPPIRIPAPPHIAIPNPAPPYVTGFGGRAPVLAAGGTGAPTPPRSTDGGAAPAVRPAAAPSQASPPLAPSPPFSQCPRVGASPSCAILIEVNADRSVTVLGDATVGPYDGGDDTLVGVQNDSSAPVDALTVSGPAASAIFGFDGDGLCTYVSVPCGATGYEGPGTSLTIDPANLDHGEVDFAGAGLAAHASAYFSLEGALTSAQLTARRGGLDTDPIHCSDVNFISARGSGEPTGQALTPETGGVLFSTLAAGLKAKHKSYDFYQLRYPADALSVLSDGLASAGTGVVDRFFQNLTKYLGGEQTGVVNLAVRIQDVENRCGPSVGFVLAGYSQGAMVLHDYLTQLAATGAPNDVKRILGAALIADPERVESSHALNFGSAPRIDHGICRTADQVIGVDLCAAGASATRDVPKAFANVWNVCDSQDIVCDTSSIEPILQASAVVGALGGVAGFIGAGAAVYTAVTHGGAVHGSYCDRKSGRCQKALQTTGAMLAAHIK